MSGLRRLLLGLGGVAAVVGAVLALRPDAPSDELLQALAVEATDATGERVLAAADVPRQILVLGVDGLTGLRLGDPADGLGGDGWLAGETEPVSGCTAWRTPTEVGDVAVGATSRDGVVVAVEVRSRGSARLTTDGLPAPGESVDRLVAEQTAVTTAALERSWLQAELRRIELDVGVAGREASVSDLGSGQVRWIQVRSGPACPGSVLRGALGRFDPPDPATLPVVDVQLQPAPEGSSCTTFDVPAGGGMRQLVAAAGVPVAAVVDHGRGPDGLGPGSSLVEVLALHPAAERGPAPTSDTGYLFLRSSYADGTPVTFVLRRPVLFVDGPGVLVVGEEPRVESLRWGTGCS